MQSGQTGAGEQGNGGRKGGVAKNKGLEGGGKTKEEEAGSQRKQGKQAR